MQQTNSMASGPTEADLWQSHVQALKLACDMRKPDALTRLRAEIVKLDNDISAWAIRREIRTRAGGDVSGLETMLKELEARMSDLASIARGVRSTPLDHDNGPTPEQAGKAKEEITGDGECTGRYSNLDPGTDDLSDELKRAAMDIQMGYAVLTKGAAAAISGRQPGGIEIGTKAETLARQYQDWIGELHRRRMSSWAVTDVVCDGLSRSESAARRRCDSGKVYVELAASLALYAKTFEPLTEA